MARSWLPLRFALREMRSGLRGFYVFVACIALGTMAIAGVGSLASSLADGLARQGRIILGGDISFSLTQREATSRELDLMRAQGTVSTAATLRAMARLPDGSASLVEIKAVDDAITPASHDWAFEVHPEVSFCAMNYCRPMPHGKKSREGKAERLELLHTVFPGVSEHLLRRPPHVGVDDLLDAAAAAWSALRIHEGIAQSVSPPELDERGLEVAIRY